MSTATTDRPIRPVWTPQDAEEVREVLAGEKHRWASFLGAKDLLLGSLHSAGKTVAGLVDRWHLGGSLRSARRVVGWLAGGVGLVGCGLRTAGVRPAIVWGLTTKVGQRVITTGAKSVAGLAVQVGGRVLRSVTWTLGLFGKRGARVTASVEARAVRARSAVAGRLLHAATAARIVLAPAGLVMQAVRTIAKGRVITAALGRFLPRPWHIVGRVLANLAVLPASVRREVMRLIVGFTPKTATVMGPEEDPTPPVSPLVNIAAERARHDELDDLPVAVPNSLQRYPARPSQHAKRRK